MHILFLLLGIWLVQVACDSSSPTKTEQDPSPTPPALQEGPSADDPQVSRTESGLGFVFLQTADGPQPQAGEVVTVHYSAALEDGTVFDSSWRRNDPFHFALGRRIVIPGWDEGIALMNLGSTIRLFIPPDLAYGRAGSPPVIPSNASLIFDVELLTIRPGTPDAPTPVSLGELTTTASGLQYIDLMEGDGPIPETGQEVQIHYTLWLTSGLQVQTTLDDGSPFSFAFGRAPLLGWDEGLQTMRVGGKRQLILPPELAFGTRGSGFVPPNATLITEVELIDLR